MNVEGFIEFWQVWIRAVFLVLDQDPLFQWVKYVHILVILTANLLSWISEAIDNMCYRQLHSPHKNDVYGFIFENSEKSLKSDINVV